MRTVGKLKYEKIIQSDVNEECAYAFFEKNSHYNNIYFLCKVNGKFFWKSMSSCNYRYHELHDTIEKAIESILNDEKYKDSYRNEETSDIYEFVDIKDFLKYCNQFF